MTLADAILIVLGAEIEARRDQLNGDPTIRSISFEVKVNQATGIPRTVLMILGTERPVVPAAAVAAERGG